MTTLIYNDVYLRDCETLSFEQSVEYDESHTDLLYSRFKIRVASNVVAMRYPSSSRQFGINPPRGETAVQRMHEIQVRLSQPRKDFWFLIESCTKLENDSGADAIDQPLIIATGEAYTEEIVESTVNSEIVETLVKTDRKLKPHPDLAETADLSTYEYGPYNEEFDASTVLDADNGPKPKSVNVRKIIGGRSLRVEFEIEICRSFCQSDFEDSKPIVLGGLDDGTANTNVLSNRWHLDESKDDNWVTTRTMQGTLRVANRDAWPHAMRYLCIPGLLRGYHRVRQSFVTDPAGLTLKYRIEDQQAHAAPPYPAIKWSGHHIESGSGPSAIEKYGEFSIRLQGPPGCDKVALIGAAGKVAVDRIKGLLPRTDEGGKKKYDTILENVAIVDVLEQPVIEFRCRARYNEHDYKALGLRIKEMGKPLMGLDPEGQDSGDNPYIIDGYRPDVWPVPLAYDSEEPAGIFNCYLQNPCSVWHGMPGGWTPQSEPIPSEENPVPEDSAAGDPYSGYKSNQGQDLFAVTESYTPPYLPEDDVPVATDTDLYDFPYSFIELTQRYKINQGWVGIPLATTDETLEQTSSLIQLHAPSAVRILTMVASRNGKPPIVPDLKPELTDHNGYREVLNHIEVANKSPTTNCDGNARVFAVEVVCHYLMEKSPKLTDKLRGASSPLDLFTPDNHMLDLSQLADTAGHIQWDDGTTATYPATSTTTTGT